MTALGPLVENAGIAWKGISWKPAQEVDELKRRNGAVRGGVGDGPPAAADRQARRRDDLPPVRDDERPARRRGLPAARAAHRHRARRPRRPTARTTGSRSSRSSIQPRKVITSPEWSGIESRTRRYSPFTVNVDREVPVAHAHRPPALLPRPRLDARVRRGPAGLPAAARRPRATPQGDLDPGDGRGRRRAGSPRTRSGRSTPSTRTTCGCSSCSAAGRSSGSAPGDAERIGAADNDWVEAVNRNGVIACRAVVSHRIPEGSVVHVPLAGPARERPDQRDVRARAAAPTTRVTRIIIKPTHLIGGYAQLSWGFNYYGAIGSQRDALDADPQAQVGGHVLMRVMAQVGMVMNLDKCIGCHTCSVTCKNVWTNRKGAEYMWFNDVETKPGIGYPKRWEDQEHWKGGWELDRKGRLRLKAGGKLRKLASIFANPDLPGPRRLLRAVDLRLQLADQRRAVQAPAGRAARLAGHRRPPGPQVGTQLGGRPRRRAGPRRSSTRTCATASRSRSRPSTSPSS